jgi:hypothetical protein
MLRTLALATLRRHEAAANIAGVAHVARAELEAALYMLLAAHSLAGTLGRDEEQALALRQLADGLGLAERLGCRPLWVGALPVE